jgi:hypothetical protein
LGRGLSPHALLHVQIKSTLQDLLPKAPSKNHNPPVFSRKQAKAVDTENNDDWNFKDLQGMRRNPKSLKGSDGERKGILIAPSKLPRFSLLEIHSGLLHPLRAANVGFRPKIRGTDGNPTNSTSGA